MARTRINVRWPVPERPGFEAVIRPSTIHRRMVSLEVYREGDPDPVGHTYCRRKDAHGTAHHWADRFLGVTLLGSANDARWVLRDRGEAENSYRWQVLWINRYGAWGHWHYADTREEAEAAVRQTVPELYLS